MKNIEEHIDALSKVLTERGFDGYFFTNYDNAGKLNESMRQHYSELQKANQPILGATLFTYSDWKDDNSAFTTCTFTVDYEKENGFRVTNLEVARKAVGATLFSMNLAVHSMDDIPYRKQVNSFSRMRKPLSAMAAQRKNLNTKNHRP